MFTSVVLVLDDVPEFVGEVAVLVVLDGAHLGRRLPLAAPRPAHCPAHVALGGGAQARGRAEAVLLVEAARPRPRAQVVAGAALRPRTEGGAPPLGAAAARPAPPILDLLGCGGGCVVGMDGIPCMDSVFCARVMPLPAAAPLAILSAVAILCSGKFCLDSITLPIPDMSAMLEEEAELCK